MGMDTRDYEHEPSKYGGKRSREGAQREKGETSEAIKAKMSQDNSTQPRPKRTTCQTCQFPPRTCICEALPQEPLHPLFRKCRILVLQHPHELRRKNRSMPLVDLCLFGSIDSEDIATPVQTDSFAMKTIVGRGLGPDRHPDVINLLADPDQVVVLVFPGPNAIDMEEGIQLAETRCGFNTEVDDDTENDDTKEQKKITLLFIDATWKHAREMETKLTKSLECKHWIRVQLVPTASKKCDNVDREMNQSTASNKSTESTTQTPFVQRRFEIRAPPSPNHLSTAECLAWVASRVERNPIIFESITKVLDYMVHLWRVNVSSGKRRKGVMTQKKLEIG